MSDAVKAAVAAAYAQAIQDVRRELLDVTTTIDGAEVVFAEDVRHDLDALTAANPYRKKLPEFVYSEFDGDVFYRSLTRPDKGDIIVRESDGQRFVVLYSWHWSTRRGAPIYMAELDYVNEPEPA